VCVCVCVCVCVYIYSTSGRACDEHLGRHVDKALYPFCPARRSRKAQPVQDLEAALIVVEDGDAGLAGHGHQTGVAFAYVHARQGLAVGRDPPLLLDVVPLGLQFPSPGHTRGEHDEVPILPKPRQASEHEQLAATCPPLSRTTSLAQHPWPNILAL
jgi:hypothetical protein